MSRWNEASFCTQPQVSPRCSCPPAVDWANMLCVTDQPKLGDAFGRRVLGDWQMLHGRLPPLLVRYLVGGTCGGGGWHMPSCTCTACSPGSVGRRALLPASACAAHPTQAMRLPAPAPSPRRRRGRLVCAAGGLAAVAAPQRAGALAPLHRPTAPGGWPWPCLCAFLSVASHPRLPPALPKCGQPCRCAPGLHLIPYALPLPCPVPTPLAPALPPAAPPPRLPPPSSSLCTQEEEITTLMNYRPEEVGELQSPLLESRAALERSQIAGLHDRCGSVPLPACLPALLHRACA